MLHDQLAQRLYIEICRIPLIDPHSHINPHQPTSRTLDDILGYHYYTELAHSSGLDKQMLAPELDPRDRVRAILAQMEQLDNTAQYQWFLEIARAFLGFNGDRVGASDADALWKTAQKRMSAANWEAAVLQQSNLEKIFLTNDFDDPLEGFDTNCYVPCLRTDDLVFHLHKPEIQARLAKATGVAATSPALLRQALGKLFDHFVQHGAKACAISLPPSFAPQPVDENDLARALNRPTEDQTACAWGTFWMLAELCRDHALPFDLMIGVNRRVYENGVYQGQDLFDQRTSLIQYAKLFNAFPTVPFCISVLSSAQNQELVSYNWIFPNVITNGHWWYSNIPAYITSDLRCRLQAVPRNKQIGYYSDMYKLEFGLPKFNMYRRILAQVLADDFIRPHIYTETQALDLARQLLRTNVMRIFKIGDN